MDINIITISSEKLDELGKLLDHKHNVNFSTKFSIYEKVPFTGADISESNDSKDKIRQQAKDILDKIQSSQEEEESIPEWMQGFEDLVYSGYNLVDGDYLVLSKLSAEQIKFLKNSVITYSRISFDKSHTSLVFKTSYGFVGYVKTYWRKKEIFFNDLFIPEQ